MSDVSARLKEIGLTPWIEPKAGMFLWCELPDGIDASAVAKRALERNVILAPGNVFSVSQSANRFLRFNVAQCPDPVFDALKDPIREESS